MKTHPHLDVEARHPLLEAARVAAENVPTPFYLYDGDAIAARYARLRNALPDAVDIRYAVKANPRPEVVKLLADLGAGADVASAAELELVLEAGVPAGRVTFAGPGKTDAELAFAIGRTIGLLAVESAGEVDRAAALAAGAGRTVRVGLRVNPREGIRGAGLAMGGGASAFGVDEEQAGAVLERIRRHNALALIALHVFAGGQTLDAAALVDHYAAVVELAARLAAAHRLSFRTVVLGSGLGIPYFPKDRPLDLGALGAGLRCIAAGLAACPGLERTRLALEPGRFLVGEAGIYVTRVVDRKRSRGRTFLITDGGLHHHLVAAGGLGQVVRRNFPVVALPRNGERIRSGPTETVDVAGPLCHPLDRLALGTELPRLEAGDLVAVLQSGAYGFTASPVNFLSHPHPREVWLREGRVRCLPRRGDAA